MICLNCAHETKVTYSKRQARAIRRRRECLSCKAKFYTCERPEEDDETMTEQELKLARRRQQAALQHLESAMADMRDVGRRIALAEGRTEDPIPEEAD